MARLSSQLDMEYVPTDHEAVSQIAEKFADGLVAYGDNYFATSSDRPYINIIDPCAGEGRAVAYLAGLLRDEITRESSERYSQGLHSAFSDDIVKVQTFGVELESERFKLARKALDRAVEADFLNTMVEPSWFDILFLNPPYDYDPDFKRLEHRFLVRATEQLKSKGALIYIVPRSTLRVSVDFLVQNYRRFNVWDPGHEDGRLYNQIVLMAEKYSDNRGVLTPSQQNDKDAILSFVKREVDKLSTPVRFYGPDDILGAYELTLGFASKPNVFTPIAVDYDSALFEMNAHGLQNSSKWRDMTVPGRLSAIRPLMPQLTGHIAQMLAANVLSEGGVALRGEDDERFLLKVSAVKVASVSFENAESMDAGAKIVTERLERRAALLNLSEWEYVDDFDVNQLIYQHRNALADYINRQMPSLYHPAFMTRPDYSRLLRRPLDGNAQRLAIEAIMFGLKNELSSIILNAEMGTGKTFVSMVAGHLAGKRRTLVVCPASMVNKWRDEIEATIPNARVYIVGEKETGYLRKHPFYKRHADRMKQFDWLLERYGHGALADEAVFVVISNTKAKNSYSRMPAVIWRRGYRPEPYYLDSGSVHHPRFMKFIRPVVDDNSLDAVKPNQADDNPSVGGSDGADVKPAPEMWMCCPTCYQPILQKDGSPVSWEWLCKAYRECRNEITIGAEEVKVGGVIRYETKTRRCGAPLWQAYAKNTTNGVDTGIGMRGNLRDTMRDRFMRAYDAVSDRGLVRNQFGVYQPSDMALKKVDNMKWLNSSAPLPPIRLDFASYIKRALPGFFDLLIADEVHQYKGKSSVQARMAGVLAEVIPQRIALTGTLMAGYAQDLFKVLYHFGPKSLRGDFGHKEIQRWNDLYGFVERRISFDDRSDSVVSRTRGSRTQDRNLPGALPNALRYILPNAVFIQLKDVVDDLPSLNEWHVSVPMSDEADDCVELQKSQSAMYKEVLDTLLRERDRLINEEQDFRTATRIVSLFAQVSQAYLDICSLPGGFKVEHPCEDGYLINLPSLRGDKLYPKEEKLIELCEKEREAGRRVLVYVTHTRKYDVQGQVKKVLSAAGFNAKIMGSSVPPSHRVRWIKDRVREGVEVVICFAGLVEVGVDLLDFPTIIWYEVDYQTARVRQASRRSWRIGQTEPVNVYYLTYAESKQTQALHLVSEKVMASLAIEGNVTREGLAGVNDRDISGQSIARMLVESGLDNSAGFEGKVRFGSDGDVSDIAGELAVTDHDVWDLESYEIDGGITADVVDGLAELELMDEGDVIEGAVVSVDGVAVSDDVRAGASTSVVLIEEPEGLDVGDSGEVDLSDWALAFGMKVEDYKSKRGGKKR